MSTRRMFVVGAAAAVVAAGLGVSYVKARANISTPSFLQLSEGSFPSLDGATTWLNSAPLSPSDLRGRVVLVNFWTYTCINWLRQLPYVRAWAEKYPDLVVIGVHTPEFSFEHGVENVRRAAHDMHVDYPIAIDSDYGVWDAFSNSYWPALYFIDATGRIRHHHFGEGAYDESERVLQGLLTEAGVTNVAADLVTGDAHGPEVAADWDDLRSPESYLGMARTSGFASPGGAVRSSARLYAAPPRLNLNQWAVDGNWTFENEAVTLNEVNGRIVYQFHARDLHLVMGPASPGTSLGLRVTLDGSPPGAAHGSDIDDEGNGTLTDQRLYQLIRQPLPVTDRRFEIEFSGTGAAGYAFTFG